MSTFDSERVSARAHASEAPPAYAQYERLRLKGAGEAGADHAESHSLDAQRAGIQEYCERNGLQADRNSSGNPLYRERHADTCETRKKSRVASGIDAQIGDLFGSLVLPQDWKQKIARQAVKAEGPRARVGPARDAPPAGARDAATAPHPAHTRGGRGARPAPGG